MIKYICFFLLFSAISWAADFRVETQLNYSTESKKVFLENTLILAESDNSWVELTPFQKGVTLFGKIIKRDKTALWFECVLTDSSTTDVVVSMPVIRASFGEKSEITLGVDTGRATISMLVMPL